MVRKGDMVRGIEKEGIYFCETTGFC